MAKATKDTLGVSNVTVVADAGYSSGTAAAACEADSITPACRTLFGRSAFVYKPETDTYICPAGNVLARKQVIRRDRMILYVSRDCAGCSLKPRCTTAERRFVSRHLHEDALEQTSARFQADPSLIRQRRCASEHPFGTIKRMIAADGSSPVDLEKSVVKQR
jgi:transposase